MEKYPVKNINFNFENSSSSILNGVNLKIDRGKVYGLVGESGSGKSTFVDLLLGLLKPVEGSITFDDIEVSSIIPKTFNENVAYVSQFPFLIDGSIVNNISFSFDNKNINFSMIKKCLSMVKLDDFLKTQSYDLNAKIGERGSKISGGQKQRIAIARALYKSPSLFIFDEATNALDNVNEEIIMNLVKKLKDYSSSILITHKISNLKKADMIFVLKDGKIINSGTYNFLQKNSDYFKKIISIEG